MKRIIKISVWVLACIFILHLLITCTGHKYLYKGIANTYLKGRIGPAIDEYSIFENRTVKRGVPQPWPVGYNYNKISLREDGLKIFEEYRTVALVVIQNDSLRYEQYWDGFSDSSFSNSFSSAKTIVSILTGIAISEGKIKSVDEPIGDFLPGFNEGMRKKITIRHLLTMSSGINFDESYISPFAFPAKAYYGTDLESLVLKYNAVDEPGKTFHYLSGNTQLLGFALEKATGVHISDYASEKLWMPLGAEQMALWSLDHAEGHEKAYCCFNTNAKDFARIGQLYLRNGNWNGRQIVPEDYVKESIQIAPLAETDGTPNLRYGFSWWLLDYKNHKIFYAQGINGQYIAVIPDKNLVMVRLGKKRNMERINGHHRDFYLYMDVMLNTF